MSSDVTINQKVQIFVGHLLIFKREINQKGEFREKCKFLCLRQRWPNNSAASWLLAFWSNWAMRDRGDRRVMSEDKRFGSLQNPVGRLPLAVTAVFLLCICVSDRFFVDTLSDSYWPWQLSDGAWDRFFVFFRGHLVWFLLQIRLSVGCGYLGSCNVY